MKSNNKGFFLAETIVILALVTVIMAFVYPNVSKVYSSFKNKAYKYDQIEDIYTLLAIKDSKEIDQFTSSDCNGVDVIGAKVLNNDCINIPLQGNPASGIEMEITKWMSTNSWLPGFTIEGLYLTSYSANKINADLDLNLKKYVNKMQNYDANKYDYRLIGVFKQGEQKRYASIKYENPNPNRGCNWE
ncbi:MAG: hypothetical protein RSA10_02470 [Bacilli bacterium]